MPAITENIAAFEGLLRSGGIALEPSPLLSDEPPALPAKPDRVAGMLWGLAIGDALGNTTESLLPGERAARHGTIRDYLPNRYADWRPAGLPSDDTQMAF